MTETGGLDGRAEPTGTGLTLDLRHPSCRAIEATGDGDGGVLAHAVYTAPESEAATGTVTGLFTAYGESSDEVDALLERVRASALAGGVLELRERFDADRTRAPERSPASSSWSTTPGRWSVQHCSNTSARPRRSSSGRTTPGLDAGPPVRRDSRTVVRNRVQRSPGDRRSEIEWTNP